MKQSLAKPSTTLGFSLVEVVIALGVAITVLVPLVALIGSASTSTARVLTQDETLKLQGAVETKLGQTEFEEIYRWIREKQPLFAYLYRAREELRPDGTPLASDWENVTSLTHTASIARSVDEADAIHADLPSLEGRLYRVDLTLSDRNFEKLLPESPAKYPDPTLTLEATYAAVRNKANYQDSEIDIQFRRALTVFR